MNNSPYFSIIIPVYNSAPYLKECLDSVQTQSYGDWEAICVDDGSSDGSPSILDDYAARDSRIQVVHQVNQGVSAARNVALGLAKGVYVTFLDSDDIWSADRLQMVRDLIGTRVVDLVRLSYQHYEGGVRPCVGARYEVRMIEARREALSWAWVDFLEYGMSWLYAIRREITDGKYYRTDMAWREDNIFLLGLVSRIRKVVIAGHDGYYYRQRTGSLIRSPYRARSKGIFCRALDSYWNELNPEFRQLSNFNELREKYQKSRKIMRFRLRDFAKIIYYSVKGWANG